LFKEASETKERFRLRASDNNKSTLLFCPKKDSNQRGSGKSIFPVAEV
jgi:hypothetical protein